MVQNRAGLRVKREIAARSSFANYGFYIGATNTNIEELKAATTADAPAPRVGFLTKERTPAAVLVGSTSYAGRIATWRLDPQAVDAEKIKSNFKAP